MEKKDGMAGLINIGKKVGDTAKEALKKTQDVGQKTTCSGMPS